MKTSNKILLTAFGVVFILILVFLFYFKSYVNSGIKGNGQIITEERQVPAFTKINIKNKIIVKYKQDSTLKLIVKTDSNLIKIVKTEVKNGTLNIYSSKDYSAKNKILIEIWANKINFIDLSQGSEFKGLNKITGDAITLKASSGSIVNADINFVSVKSKISSGCIVELSGNAKNLELKSSSGSILKAGSLLVDNCFITSSSGSICKINVSKELSVNASSGSIVKYLGNPDMKEIDISYGAMLTKIK